MKDWIGNGKSVFVCNGASNHSDEEREKGYKGETTIGWI